MHNRIDDKFSQSFERYLVSVYALGFNNFKSNKNLRQKILIGKIDLIDNRPRIFSIIYEYRLGFPAKDAALYQSAELTPTGQQRIRIGRRKLLATPRQNAPILQLSGRDFSKRLALSVRFTVFLCNTEHPRAKLRGISFRDCKFQMHFLLPQSHRPQRSISSTLPPHIAPAPQQKNPGENRGSSRMVVHSAPRWKTTIWRKFLCHNRLYNKVMPIKPSKTLLPSYHLRTS